MFTWSLKSEAKARAKSQDVWSLWRDVASWPLWSQEIEWSTLEGLFEKGALGTIKPKGWPASKFVVTKVKEGQSFTTESSLPKTKMTFSYQITSDKEMITITHQVKVTGLLAPLLWITARPLMKKNIQKNVENIATRVNR